MKRLLILSALLVMTPATATAWDTAVNVQDDWRAQYGTDGSKYCRTQTYHPEGEDPDNHATHGGGNEHAEIADDTLWIINPKLREKIGIGGTFGVAQSEEFKVVDLNGSVHRRKFSNTAYDDDQTLLEERALGDLVRFAGLPDFNYTVYDWINKSKICPSLPPDLSDAQKAAIAYDKCHSYPVWKGAALNSTHFGTLATRMWIRFHQIAMQRAQRARELYEALEVSNGTLPKGLQFHRDYVIEAELMALIYEFAGQHFLQDRWSVGHMFSRWGPGGYENIPRDSNDGSLNLTALVAAGMMTGIVHGTEAVFEFPEPAASPLIVDNTFSDDEIVETTWVYSQPNRLWQPDATQTGVGDYRFGDLIDGRFDGTRVCSVEEQSPKVDPEAMLTSQNQLKALRYCTASALRRVISNFGEREGENRFGALDVELKKSREGSLTLPGESATGADLTQPGTDEYNICHDAWLDNGSYYRSYMTIFGTGELNPAKDIWFTFKGLTADAPDDAPSAWTAMRVVGQLTRKRWLAHRNKERDEAESKRRGLSKPVYKNDTARRGFTLSFQRYTGFGSVSFRPNNAYDVPEYVEPADLDTLEDALETEKDTGKDKWSVFGFFNRGTTKYWCDGGPGDHEDLQAFLEDVRRGKEYYQKNPMERAEVETQKKRDAELAMCAYLAHRVYKQTDPAYLDTGSRFERAGAHMPVGAETKYGDEFEPICTYLDPALAQQTAFTRESEIRFLHPGYVDGPGEAAEVGLALASVERWCERIPVLDFANDDENYPNKVGEIGRDLSEGNRFARLSGANLGIRTSSAVGTVEITPQGTENWLPLPIFDPDSGEFSGGWSKDNRTVNPRVPGSVLDPQYGVAVPSNANAQMTISEMKSAPPAVYNLRVTQPEDLANVLDFQSEGKQSVGDYELLVYPTILESPTGSFTPGQPKAFFADWPAVSRSNTTILAKGVYRVLRDQNNNITSYEEVDITPYVVAEDMSGYWMETPNGLEFVADENRFGVYLEPPSDTSWGAFDTPGEYVWIFAFH